MNYVWAGLIIDELFQLGVEHFCISPGSRSTPLALSVAHHPHARYTLCHDERSTAFLALGIGRATRKPAAIIVSSGTAVANLFPAVVEAAQDHIPMVILSADRPPELRQNGANQGIDQSKIFGDYARFFFDFPCPSEAIHPRVVQSTIDYAYFIATGNDAGPVHLNCQFREPLAPSSTLTLEPSPASGRGQCTQYLHVHQLSEVKKILQHAENGLLIVGAIHTKQEQEAAITIAQKLRWPIVADVTSKIRWQREFAGMNALEHIMREENCPDELVPDVIVHLGGRLITDRLAPLCKKRMGKPYIQVRSSPDRIDPHCVVTHRVVADIEQFANCLETLTTHPNWQYEKFLALSQKAQSAISCVLKETQTITESFVARHIAETITDGHDLFISTSMPVRDMQWFANSQKNDVTVYANRGASGIDGLVSTACGIAHSSGRPLTLLIGDLAMMHDSNGLSLLKNMSVPVTIIILNNQGGGIFHFLPVAAVGPLSPVMDTPHAFCLRGLSETFGIEHHVVTSCQELIDSYARAQSSHGHCVIEVKTSSQSNVLFHRNVRDAVQKIL